MIQLLRFTLFFWRTYLVRTLLTKRMLLVALGCMVPPVMAWFGQSVSQDAKCFSVGNLETSTPTSETTV